MRGGVAIRSSASHERAREDWITIAVPPILSDETFARAKERLQVKDSRAAPLDALAPTPTGIFLVPSATTALFDRIY
jgi:hypothetical protein